MLLDLLQLLWYVHLVIVPLHHLYLAVDDLGERVDNVRAESWVDIVHRELALARAVLRPVRVVTHALVVAMVTGVVVMGT